MYTTVIYVFSRINECQKKLVQRKKEKWLEYSESIITGTSSKWWLDAYTCVYIYIFLFWSICVSLFIAMCEGVVMNPLFVFLDKCVTKTWAVWKSAVLCTDTNIMIWINQFLAPWAQITTSLDVHKFIKGSTRLILSDLFVLELTSGCLM